MKLLKKVLCLCLLCSMLVVSTAFARYSTEESELVKLGILTSEGWAETAQKETVSRAEMTVIVCRLCGLEKAAKEAVVTSPVFSDVSKDDVLSGYIQVAKENGIVNGYPDGSFMPNKGIRYQEALKMLVAVLGYLPKAETMAAYPDGVLMTASQLGLTEGFSFVGEKGACFLDVVAAVIHALDVPLLVQVGFGAEAQYETVPDLTLRNQNFQIKE